jgi:predicted transcriptional regulator
MSLGFSISGASDEQDVLSSWGELSQLIKSEALTLGGKDSLPGFVGESKSTNSKSLLDVQKSGIVSYRSNNGKNSGVELGLSLRNWSLIVRKGAGNS